MGKPAGFLDKLFQLGEIGTLKLKNRLIRASMWTAYCDAEGFVTQRLLRHYSELALGGVGLVMVEYNHIDKKSSKSNFGQLSVAGDEYVPGLASLATAIKRNGARAGLQISHAGGQRYLMGLPPRVPSQAPWRAIQNEGQTPAEELSVEEIEEIVEAFGEAALRAKKAGFDLVEVHACHGYLLTQFLSPATNKRPDRYGGYIQNRMRLLIEIIQNIRNKAGSIFPLTVRLNGSEYLDGGITIEETLETARMLERYGVNALHVSGGTHRTTDKIIVPMYWPIGYHVWAAEQIKRTVGIPVIASGSFTTPDLAEDVLKAGKADFISLARPLLADPAYPRKAKEGYLEDIVPCIRCNIGCQGLPEGVVSCTVNVAAGKEDEAGIKKVTNPKKVAVIGGGPAGMEAARVAAIMGHEVTLFEKRKLGGMLVEASGPEFKADLRRLIKYLSQQVVKLGVKVIYENADLETVKKITPDIVILAAGAVPIMPDFTGAGRPIIVGALDVLNGAEVGKDLLVVGGGFVGSETALFLAEQDKKVNIIEMLGQLLSEVKSPAPRLAFFEKLNKRNVKIETNKKLEEVTEEGIIVTNEQGEKIPLKADTVILALGLKSDHKLYNELKSLPNLDTYIIGDYAEPRNVYDAIHEGHRIARGL